jgi:hypothetical protein
MDREWNESQPIYRQLRDRVVAMILDGLLKEGDPLPSCAMSRPNTESIRSRQVLGRSILLFDLKVDHADHQRLAALGDVWTPTIADLFLAMLGNKPGNQAGVAQGVAQ